jgi:chaperone modulatory protein CbpM
MMQFIISDVSSPLNFTELCHSTNLNETQLHELIEFSVVTPLAGNHMHEWLFEVASVSLIKKATRIHRDLAIDWAGIALILNLLDDIEKLQTENNQLKKQLSRFRVS